MTVSRLEIANFMPDNKTIAINVLRVAGNIDSHYECYTNRDGPYKETFATGRDPDAFSPTSQSSTLFLTSALYEVGWLTPCPGRFTPGNDPLPIA